MVRLSRSRAWNTAGVIALVAAALATVASVGSGPAGAATPTLDHFQCYAAAATTSPMLSGPPFPATPPAVLLENSFAPAGFLASTGAVQMHCNPVRKVLVTGAATKIMNPNAHLLCWGIKPNKLVRPALVTLSNQFGSGAMKPTAVLSLCLPSWKNVDSPSFPAAKAPPGLDHFTCYSVVHPAGTPAFKPPASLTLNDQFQKTTVANIGTPNILCLPTAKTVDPAKGPTTIVNPDHSLVCFPIPPATSFVPRTVFDKNQFGIGAVAVRTNNELCVPSTTSGTGTG